MKSVMEVVPISKDGMPMTSEILNVVIDERKQLSSVDNAALLEAAGKKFMAGQASHRRVFKDYILSSEIFYVDSTLS